MSTNRVPEIGTGAYLLIVTQSNEERSLWDVVSDQQELQGLQDCLGFRKTMEEERVRLFK